jgi:hypothetical protein
MPHFKPSARWRVAAGGNAARQVRCYPEPGRADSGIGHIGVKAAKTRKRGRAGGTRGPRRRGRTGRGEPDGAGPLSAQRGAGFAARRAGPSSAARRRRGAVPSARPSPRQSLPAGGDRPGRPGARPRFSIACTPWRKYNARRYLVRLVPRVHLRDGGARASPGSLNPKRRRFAERRVARPYRPRFAICGRGRVACGGSLVSLTGAELLP